MKDKIQEINSLQRNIEELKDFLDVLERGNVRSSYSTKDEIKINKFNFLCVSAYCWTGTQAPEYLKTIKNQEVINKLKSSMVEIIKQELEILSLKLKNLIN